jgi:hypothetical protein
MSRLLMRIVATEPGRSPVALPESPWD